MTPFDLEAFKAGAPAYFLGRPVTFVALVPQAFEDHRLVVLDNGRIATFCADGSYLAGGPSSADLTMTKDEQ